MTEMQRYLAEEVAEDLTDGLISRREAIRRLGLLRTTRPEENALPAGLENMIQWGAGPRATIALLLAAKARALFNRRCHATTGDLRAVALPVLRHRIILTFNAEAAGVDADCRSCKRSCKRRNRWPRHESAFPHQPIRAHGHRPLRRGPGRSARDGTRLGAWSCSRAAWSRAFFPASIARRTKGAAASLPSIGLTPPGTRSATSTGRSMPATTATSFGSLKKRRTCRRRLRWTPAARCDSGLSTVSKFEYARRAAACLARLLLHQRDAIGAAILHESSPVFVPPRQNAGSPAGDPVRPEERRAVGRGQPARR